VIGRGDIRVALVKRVPAWALCLDFDPGHTPPPDAYLRTLLRRAGYAIVGRVLRRRSASRRGWHLVVRTRPRPRSLMELVALQAVCGSDAYREACNVARARVAPRMEAYWRRRVTVLYEGDR